MAFNVVNKRLYAGILYFYLNYSTWFEPSWRNTSSPLDSRGLFAYMVGEGLSSTMCVRPVCRCEVPVVPSWRQTGGALVLNQIPVDALSGSTNTPIPRDCVRRNMLRRLLIRRGSLFIAPQGGMGV